MDFLAIFRDLAFPIAVAAYLLFSHGKKLEDILDELGEVKTNLALLLDRQDRADRKEA